MSGIELHNQHFSCLKDYKCSLASFTIIQPSCLGILNMQIYKVYSLFSFCSVCRVKSGIQDPISYQCIKKISTHLWCKIFVPHCVPFHGSSLTAYKSCLSPQYNLIYVLFQQEVLKSQAATADHSSVHSEQLHNKLLTVH